MSDSGLRCAAVEADADQVWGGMVWHANPLQRFGNTAGVFTEELQAELQRRGLEDCLLLTVPEVEEAGSISQALADIEQAIVKALGATEAAPAPVPAMA